MRREPSTVPPTNMMHRRSSVLLIILAATIFLIGCGRPNAASTQLFTPTNPFDGFDGCFVIHDVRRNQTTRFNQPRCAERLSPCSTFKIPNALIGLETGVVTGADHLFKWD